MNTSLPERPVVGAICLSPGTPEASARLREIADMGMTMCETILFRGDTSPERRPEIRAFLDEAAELGVAVLLEPTYQPDTKAHPEASVVIAGGSAKTRDDGWGGFCYRTAEYRRQLAQFTEEVCRAYMDHPAILTEKGRKVLAVGHEMQYQTSEKDGHGDAIAAMSCYCPECTSAFRSWLSDRHEGDVARYNDRHEVSITSFDAIKAPLEPQPDRVLWQEWVDHHATAIPEAIAIQREIIEREVPGALVTHEINDWYPNTWDCIYAGNNFWMMGRELEHAFNDQYPMEWAPGSLWRIYLYTFTQDATQSSFDFDSGFWTNGQAFPSWQGDLCSPPTVAHAEQCYSALIHGANGLFWWTGGDVFPTTGEASREYLRLVEMVGDARPRKDPVAVLVPWTTYAQTRSADRGDSLMGGYQLLSRLGYQVEIVDESQVAEGVLAERGYRVLCAWGNSSLTPEARAAVEQFVCDGGLLLADYGDGDTDPYFPAFSDMISFEMDFACAYSLPGGARIPVHSRAQAVGTPPGSTVLARFGNRAPAIVRRPVGKGTVLRFGSLAGVDYAAGMGLYDWLHQERVRIEPAMEWFVQAELAEAGILPLARMENPNMEVALLPVGGRTMAVAVNHLRHAVAADLVASVPATKATDALTGESIDIKSEEGACRVRLSFAEMGGRAVWLD